MLSSKVPFPSREKEGEVWELRGSGWVNTEESRVGRELAPNSKLRRIGGGGC